MSAPNILFILIDELRRQSVGHLGGPMATPHIDGLAAYGVSFSRSYCTYPMCTPTRAALLTGRCCHALQDAEGRPYMYNDRQLDLSVPTYAKALNEIGYRCAYIGKWHNDGRGEKFIPPGPRRQGFDDYFAGVEGGSTHTQPFIFSDDGERVEFGNRWEPDVQTDLAKHYIERVSRDEEPFCLVVSFSPPHGPHDLPPSRLALLDRAAAGLGGAVRANVPESLRHEAAELSLQYHANVLGIDDCVGDLLACLDRLGLAEDTAVVLVSDHGSHLLSHGLYGKNQGYEEAIGVPIVFRCPGRIAPQPTNTSFVTHIDIAPTLLDLAGADVPATMQGRSLAPLLTGLDSEGPNDSAFIEVDHPWFDFRFGQGPGGNKRCFVTERWKLVLLESAAGMGRVIPYQLFDRANDPDEVTNQVDDPASQCVITRLMHDVAWPWMGRTEDGFFDLTLHGLDERIIRQMKRSHARPRPAASPVPS